MSYSDEEYEYAAEVPLDEYGVCCYCEGECNPHSQACGSCMRNGFLWAAPVYEKEDIKIKHMKEVEPHFAALLLQLDEKDRTCPICTDVIIDKMHLTVCQHLFHTHCLDEWKKNKNTCPTCRKELKDS